MMMGIIYGPGILLVIEYRDCSMLGAIILIFCAHNQACGCIQNCVTFLILKEVMLLKYYVSPARHGSHRTTRIDIVNNNNYRNGK